MLKGTTRSKIAGSVVPPLLRTSVINGHSAAILGNSTGLQRHRHSSGGSALLYSVPTITKTVEGYPSTSITNSTKSRRSSSSSATVTTLLTNADQQPINNNNNNSNSVHLPRFNFFTRSFYHSAAIAINNTTLNPLLQQRVGDPPLRPWSEHCDELRRPRFFNHIQRANFKSTSLLDILPEESRHHEEQQQQQQQQQPDHMDQHQQQGQQQQEQNHTPQTDPQINTGAATFETTTATSSSHHPKPPEEHRLYEATKQLNKAFKDSVILRAHDLDRFVRTMGISTMMGGLSLLFLLALAVYMFRDSLVEVGSKQAADVATRAVENEELLSKATLGLKMVTTDALKHPDTVNQLIDLLKTLLSNPDTKDIAIGFLTQLLADPGTQAAAKNFLKGTLQGLLADPETQKFLTQFLQAMMNDPHFYNAAVGFLKSLITNKSTQEALVQLLKWVMTDPVIRDEYAVTFVKHILSTPTLMDQVQEFGKWVVHQILNDQHVYNHAVSFVKSILYDSQVQKGGGDALWGMLINMVTPTWLARTTEPAKDYEEDQQQQQSAAATTTTTTSTQVDKAQQAQAAQQQGQEASIITPTTITTIPSVADKEEEQEEQQHHNNFEISATTNSTTVDATTSSSSS